MVIPKTHAENQSQLISIAMRAAIATLPTHRRVTLRLVPIFGISERRSQIGGTQEEGRRE